MQRSRRHDEPSSGEELATHAESDVEERDTHVGDDAPASSFADVDLPQYRLQGLTAALVMTVYIGWLYAMMDLWCAPIVFYLLCKAVRPPHLL